MSSLPDYRGHPFQPETSQLHGVTRILSLRDIEEILVRRNVLVSFESIRQWRARFGRECAKRRQKEARTGWRPLVP